VRARARHGGLWLWTAVVIAYMLVPIVVVVLYSFNSTRSLQTFGGFSTRWYEEFLADDELRASLWVSLKLAVLTVIGATVLGTLLAFGLVRYRGRFGGSANILMLLPMVTPEIILGVSLLLLFSQVLALDSGFTTLVIAHITFSLSFVTVIVRSRLVALGPDLEEAAQDLGATPLQALRLVVIPNLLPAIVGGMLLTFAISFDDFTVSFFNSGIGEQPLPVRIYTQIKFGISPAINAVGATLFAVTLLTLALALLVPRLLGRGGRGESSLGSIGDVV